jgi:chromosome segregation ATPase
MRGYAIRSDTMSCAMILMGDENYTILDFQALSILEGVTEKYKINPPAAQSLYQLIPKPTFAVDMKGWTIVKHTQQSISEVADRMGWVRSQLDPVKRNASQIEDLQRSLKDMLENVSELNLVLSRADKSCDTSGKLSIKLSIIEVKIGTTRKMAQNHSMDLALYATELEALNMTLKNVNTEEFDKQKDLIPDRSMLVEGQEVAILNDETNKIQAKLGDITLLLQAEDTQIEHIQKELKVITGVLRDTFEKMNQRGEKISSLTKQSDRLAKDSASFKSQVRMSIAFQR